MKDWEKASRCKRPGRYVTPMGVDLWRLDEREGGEPPVGWERWDDAHEDWIIDTPETPLHYIPPCEEDFTPGQLPLIANLTDEERRARVEVAIEKAVEHCPDDLGHVPGPGRPI